MQSDYMKEKVVHPYDVMVEFTCSECGEEYSLAYDDVLDIHTDGHLHCNCGATINLHNELGLMWQT